MIVWTEDLPQAANCAAESIEHLAISLANRNADVASYLAVAETSFAIEKAGGPREFLS